MKKILPLILLISLSLISCGLEKLLSSGALIQGAKVGYELSTINKNSDFFLPETKYYIGRSVSAYILSRYDPCITEQYSQLINYIKKIGHTLAMASDYPETFQDYRFIILNSDEINAFAVPSGFIFITTGTIKKAKSEDEIAGVLAHEISHIVLNHPINSLKEETQKRVLAKIVQLGIIFGVQNQNINQSVDLFEELVNELGQLVINGYDADKEKEADLQAVKLLYKTGYNPNDLKTFISRLKLGDNIHGTTQKRAFYVKQRIEKLSKTYSRKKFSYEKRQKRFREITISFAN